MAKDPAGRYAAAQELADDLGSVPQARADPGAAEQRLGTVGEVGAAAAGDRGPAGDDRPGLPSWASRASPRSGSGPNAHVLTETEMQCRHSRRRLYFNRIALADRELAVNNLRRVDQLLADCPPELRGWEWNYLKRARYGYLPVDLPCRDPGRRRGVQPRRPRLVTAQLDGTAVIWDAATGKARHVLDPASASGASPSAPTAGESPSNSFSETMIWDAMTGQLIDSAQDDGRVNGWSVEFSPDGRTIAVPAAREENERYGRHDLGRDDPPVDPDDSPPERVQALDLQPRRHPSRR